MFIRTSTKDFRQHDGVNVSSGNAFGEVRPQPNDSIDIVGNFLRRHETTVQTKSL